MANSTTAPPKTRKTSRKPVVSIARNQPPEPANAVPAPPEPAVPPPLEPQDPPEPPPIAAEAAPAPPAPPKAFPMPPRARLPGGYVEPEEGMAYWRTVFAEFPDRVVVYVNREWPRLNRLQELNAEERTLIAQKKRKEPAKYIDKLSQPYGEAFTLDVLHRYGSGRYKLYLNDAGISGVGAGRGNKIPPELSSRNVCKFFITVNDSDAPPVLDPTRPDQGIGILDLTHPENQSYITELRIRGVLPQLEGVEDMGTAAAERLAATVESLAGKVGLLQNDQLIGKLKEEIAAAGGGGLQVKMLELLIATISKPAAAPVDVTAPLVKIFETQISQLTAELKAEREERRAYEAAARQKANEPGPDPFALFERMTTQLSKFRELTGKDGSDGGGKHGTRMNGTLEFLSNVIPQIIDSPILNALAAKLSMGGPGADVGLAGNPAAPNPHAPAGAAGTPPPALNPAQAELELLRFIQNIITPAMFEFLEAGNTGADFASWVDDGFPNRLYELQRRGPAVIIATYQQSPAWPRIQPRAAQFQQFVESFCTWRPPTEQPDDEDPALAAAGAAVASEVIDLDAPLEGEPII